MSTVDVLVKIARAQQRGTLPSDTGIDHPSRSKQVILTPSGGNSGTIGPLLVAQEGIEEWLDRNFARHDGMWRGWAARREVEEIRYSERGRKMLTRGWYERKHLRWTDGSDTMIEMDVLVPHVHRLPLNGRSIRTASSAIRTTWYCSGCRQKLTVEQVEELGAHS